MFKMIANACPQAVTMQARVCSMEHSMMVTPIKLLMKAKGLSYDDNDFDEEDHITLDAVFQKVLEWNDINSIMSIESFNLGVANETNNLYPFMIAATGDEINLETLYHLAMYDPKLIFELVSLETKAPSKRARHV